MSGRRPRLLVGKQKRFVDVFACEEFNPLNTEFASRKKTHFLSDISFLDRFSTSTVISMEMAKNEIFSYCLFCFWNGNCWLCWHLFITVGCLFYYFFLISERSAMESLETLSRFLEHSKWFAPICEGATFAWRITTTSLSRTWSLFVLDERKSNRGVRMCRRSSQLKMQNSKRKNAGFSSCTPHVNCSKRK